jgi:putative oxidoreductase
MQYSLKIKCRFVCRKGLQRGKEQHFMRYLPLVGRILFALIFITAAPRHFAHEGIQHAADLGVPLARLLVPVSGAMALAGGFSVALGYKARWGAWALVAFLLPVTAMMHAFWALHDPAQAHVQQAMFAKNVSMLGAALLLAYFGSGPLSLDGGR